MILEAKKYYLIVLVISLLLINSAYGADNIIAPTGVLDTVVNVFKQDLYKMIEPIKSAALRLFWFLVLCSLISTGIKYIFAEDNFRGFFATFIWIIIFTGLFLFLLNNGPDIGASIIDSFIQIANNNKNISGPSELIDKIWDVYHLVDKNIDSGLLNLDVALGMRICSIIFVIVLFLIVIKYTTTYLAAICLCVAGVFAVAFGPFKPTRDIAINYLKAMIGCALELMALIIVINCGVNILQSSINALSGTKNLSFDILFSLIFIALFLYGLCVYFPQMLSALVYNSQINTNPHRHIFATAKSGTKSFIKFISSDSGQRQ